ncbi:MAG: hypothetical protein WDO24_01480 [Pseudomonadota bacterium]
MGPAADDLHPIESIDFGKIRGPDWDDIGHGHRLITAKVSQRFRDPYRFRWLVEDEIDRGTIVADDLGTKAVQRITGQPAECL